MRWLKLLQYNRPNQQADDGWQVVFVPISIRFNTNRPEVFYEAIAARLAKALAKQLEPAYTDPATYYEDRCRSLLVEAAERKKQVLIIIDGIDEALGDRFDASWFPKSTISTIRLIVSARLQVGDRNWEGWAKRLSWTSGVRMQALDLTRLSMPDIKDLLTQAGAPIDVLVDQPNIVEKLYDLSEGEPLLVKLYVEDLWKHAPDLRQLGAEDLDRIKPGLRGYFQDWINRHPDLWQEDTPVLRYLAVLACTYGPLSSSELSDLTCKSFGIRPGLRVENALRPARRFVIGTSKLSLDDNAGYVLAHPKFGEFLREYFDYDQIERVRQSLAAWGRDTTSQLNSGALAVQRCPIYLLHYLTQHLADVNADTVDYMSLLERGWMLAWHSSDKHYAGYAGDIRRVQREATRNCDIRLEIRCALALGTVASLSESVSTPMLTLALEGGVITGSQAAGLIRHVPDAWARAVSVAAVGRTADHGLALRLLEIADDILDVEAKFLAKAGLIDHLASFSQEPIPTGGDVKTSCSSALSELLASRLVNEEGFLRADKQLLNRLDDLFASWAYGSDMGMFSRRIGEVISVLRPADQATFARAALRATRHRSYRYDESNWSQLFVDAVVEHSPIDVLPALVELLRRSPEPTDTSYIRIAARYATLGDPSHVEPALEDLNPARRWAASYALPILGKEDRERWSASCVAEFESSAEWRKHVEAITLCLRFRPADERNKIATRLWSEVRRISDTSERFSFATRVLRDVSGNQRTGLSDSVAKKILDSGSPDLRSIAAETGRYVSDTWLAPVRNFLGDDIDALCRLAPRFGIEERAELLQSILGRDLLSSSVRKK